MATNSEGVLNFDKEWHMCLTATALSGHIPVSQISADHIDTHHGPKLPFCFTASRTRRVWVMQGGPLS